MFSIPGRLDRENWFGRHRFARPRLDSTGPNRADQRLLSAAPSSHRGIQVTLSARNRLSGEVRSVETEGLMGRVEIAVEGGQTVTAIITSESVDGLDLAVGDSVEAVVKATGVMVEK